jgi:hypothetical protein
MMAPHDFTTAFEVSRTVEEVYAAVLNVRAWWTGTIEGGTDRLGQEFTYRFQDLHFSRQKITELTPGKRVVWRVTEAHLSFAKEPDEWAGTDIIFTMRPVAGGTELQFTHRGLSPEVECYAACSSGWRTFIKGSLFHLLSTGQPWDEDFAVQALLGRGAVTYPA